MPTWPESQRQETNEGDVTAVRETALQPSDHPVHTRVDAVFAAAFTFSVAAAESNCGGETGGSSLTMSFCLSKSPVSSSVVRKLFFFRSTVLGHKTSQDEKPYFYFLLNSLQWRLSPAQNRRVHATRSISAIGMPCVSHGSKVRNWEQQPGRGQHWSE
jgi:hypothetical protein